MESRWVSKLVLLVLLTACGQDGSGSGDASVKDQAGPPPQDGIATGDNGSSGGAVVDFVVQGCDKLTDSRCEGRVPLNLTFLAMVEEEALSVTWDFGDGSDPAEGLVVTHAYALVGTFDITLTVGETTGTNSTTKQGFVVVRPAQAGAACNSDTSCQSGDCICHETCTFPLDRGLCLSKCSQWSICPGGTACIVLGDTPAPQESPWQTSLCLPTCGSDVQCERTDFFCRWAPSINGWQKACIPPLMRSIGEPCLNDQGEPDSSLCLGGLCLNVGSSGYCTAACSSESCPSGTRCVTFAAGMVGPVCLLRCDGSGCDHDPVLACESPGGVGDYSFSVLGSPDSSDAEYCSVKRCGTDAQCGLMGRCDKEIGGYCLPE